MKEENSLIESFSEFKESKSIDRETLMFIMEDVCKHMLLKKYGAEANISVIVNPDKGDIEFQRYFEIVEDGNLSNPVTQIELSEAIKIEPDFEVGEEVCEKIRLEDFGRREILSLRQNLATKIMEYEGDLIYQKYKSRIGEIVSGTVHQVFKKEILLLDEEGIELFLPKTEQIPGDFYKKGDPIRAVVIKVEPRVNSSFIVASRTSPVFLERLMEEEIPEIYDGLIMIKNIVRVPGERAKIAVETYDDRIDPVGACVGMKGVRIHGIVRELRNENIDVINYTTNTALYISRALSPAKITGIEINEENKSVSVFMKPDQISLAIGKGGSNIKLASKLTGYEIDIFRNDAIDEEDVELQEFSDEIEQWILDTFKNIGCYTAKNVLDISREELIERTDLEEETVDEVLRIIKAEFEQ
ncbi:MAG: transcription termination factor NusA [Bacteroidales bacterium]|jgi:N utilization substance protein A|nr:transcription termination factor NusA [Bacteroidales bacterium]MDD3330785.1 transcription termination factor NusA [Bacteroidales bacterium]MDD3691260.1 transcription termination factor NusA [Bacteroidales bacterium]MDD4044415.1 transcription termination factor NusA [Bacteroidales bacterium]MDD4581350.1 transcription termination factor NusA [Bacteroidales bacterium]